MAVPSGSNENRAKVIYIYDDAGTSEASVTGWILTLNAYFLNPSTVQIRLTTSSSIVHDLRSQPPNQTVLLIPGGADLPYVHALKGSRADHIQAVVHAGASYIGVCAGGYFASRVCVFEPNDPKLRVVGARPLNFIPFPAVGPVRRGFKYRSEAGATIEPLTCFAGDVQFKAQIYCNGGPGWPYVCSSTPPSSLKEADSNWEDKTYAEKIIDGIVQSDKTTVIARYTEPLLERHDIPKESAPAAIISHTVGEGVAIVCGVHPELTPHILSEKDTTYQLLKEMFSAARLISYI